MVAEEVIPLSMKEANAPDEPDSDCVEKQEEQMGIFQILDRLEEAVDALPNTVSAASPSTLEQNFKAKNSKTLFICSICKKPFANSVTLKTHMRVHTGEKPHTCPKCAKSFADLSNFRTHLRVHTGEKPHTCPHCTKSFSHSRNLRSHLRIHAGDTTFKNSHR